MKESLIKKIDMHWRLANYISVCQIYLKDNIFLKRKMSIDDLKEINSGHWGVAPSLNFAYAHLNSFIKRHNKKAVLVIGAGHAGCALLSNLYIDGIITKYYNEYTYDINGLLKLINSFGTENGFRTEINPEFPLTIYDGGELGYSLPVAIGAALDNKDIFVPCFIGDGESETGSISASWQLIRYINKEFSGKVLPILNLNGKKMGSNSIFSSMTKEDLKKYFESIGYKVIFVYGNHNEMYEALEKINENYNENYIIILKTPKGWTAINDAEILIEDKLISHKNPLHIVDNKYRKAKYLEKWLKSYNINESDIKENTIPKTHNFIQCSLKNNIKFPDIKRFSISNETYKNVTILSDYISWIIENNNNFRIFSPDELVSNGFSKLYESTKNNIDVNNFYENGKITEILNENICQGLMQGYIQTGRHALFIGYEAFMPIITSMISQLMKYMYQAKKVAWRESIPSFTYILTSVCWENNYSHQNPEFINTILNKNYDFVNVYMPLDANCALVYMEKCLESSNSINVIVSSKGNSKQYKNINQAMELLKNDGIEIISDLDKKEDLILVASGDYIYEEILEATKMLKEKLPNIIIKNVYISELRKIGSKKIFRDALTDEEFEDIFPINIPTIYAIHGYESVVKNLIYDRKNKFSVIGYKDKSDIAGSRYRKMELNGVYRYNIFHLAVKKLYESSKIDYRTYINIINEWR